MSVDDRDALLQAVRSARPPAPEDLEARVLRLARTGSRRRPMAAIAAGLLVLAAALILVVVERASPGTTAPVAGPDVPVARPAQRIPTPAPARISEPPASDAPWTDLPAFLERVLTPQLDALRACDATPGTHRIALRIEASPPAPRPGGSGAPSVTGTRVSYAGALDRTAADRCFEGVVARLTLPRLPDQLVNLDVVIAVPSGGEPLGLDSTPEASAWRDPVIVVRTYMLSDFSKKPSRNPFTVDRCIPRNARSRTREPSRIEVELARDVHGVTRSRYLPDPSRNPAAVDRCLDARIAELRFPTLPPSLPRLTVVYRPANR